MIQLLLIMFLLVIASGLAIGLLLRHMPDEKDLWP